MILSGDQQDIFEESVMRIIEASEAHIRDWFGNRGYPIDDASRITFRVVESESQWIFIHDSNDEDNEVIAYAMGSYCEPFDGWPAKGFSWAKKSLEELVRNMEE